MKKLMFVLVVLALLVVPSAALARGGGKPGGCTRIQDGVLTNGSYRSPYYNESALLHLGFDEYGYNFQGHMFKGSLANNYLGRYGYPPYEGDDPAYYQRLVDEGYAATIAAAQALMSGVPYWADRHTYLEMKWSDEWLSNADCNGDGKLDKGYACDSVNASSSACEGAWLTNHQKGTDGNGDLWTYFSKMVYPPGGPVDTNPNDGYDDNNGGEIIWVSYVVLKRVYSGSGAVHYASPVGFGAYK